MRLNRSYFDESIASSSWLIHSWNLFSLAKGTDHGRYLVQQDMARLYGQKVFGRRCYSSPWVLLSRTSSFWCFLGIRAALPFLSMMLPWLRCHNSWSQYMYSQEWYPPVIKHGNGKSPLHGGSNGKLIYNWWIFMHFPYLECWSITSTKPQKFWACLSGLPRWVVHIFQELVGEVDTSQSKLLKYSTNKKIEKKKTY
jgi:hypothetical protein